MPHTFPGSECETNQECFSARTQRETVGHTGIHLRAPGQAIQKHACARIKRPRNLDATALWVTTRVCVCSAYTSAGERVARRTGISTRNRVMRRGAPGCWTFVIGQKMRNSAFTNSVCQIQEGLRAAIEKEEVTKVTMA